MTERIQRSLPRIFPLIALLLFSCRKYPEDKFISLKRPSYRIQGQYKLLHFYVNGFDSVNNPKNHYYAAGYLITVPKSEFALYDPVLGFKFDVDKGTYTDEENAGIGFRNNHKSIWVTKNRLFNPNDAQTWDIKELYGHDLIISATISGNLTEIHLHKK